MVELLRRGSAPGSEAVGRDGSWAERVPAQRLADASLLLPELAGLRDDLPDRRRWTARARRTRLLEAVTAVIGAACGGPVPGVVVLDDAHAADEATVDVVSYLGRRLSGRALLLVIAWRSEGMLPGHRLRRLAVDLAREGRATIVSPGTPRRGGVAELARAAGLGDAAPDIGRRLYLESEGLPLFVAEYLAALRSGSDPAELTCSQEVRGLLERGFSRLGPVARQVLGAAAAIGRSFDMDTVREASGRTDEETVDALEELVTQGLVREVVGHRARL